MSHNKTKDRVDRGIAFMDAKYPGWWKKVDLEKFDILSGCNCVIGQVVGEYVFAVTDLFGPKYGDMVVSLGFNSILALDTGGPDYQDAKAIQAFWRDEILRRQADANLPTV